MSKIGRIQIAAYVSAQFPVRSLCSSLFGIYTLIIWRDSWYVWKHPTGNGQDFGSKRGARIKSDTTGIIRAPLDYLLRPSS